MSPRSPPALPASPGSRRFPAVRWRRGRFRRESAPASALTTLRTTLGRDWSSDPRSRNATRLSTPPAHQMRQCPGDVAAAAEEIAARRPPNSTTAGASSCAAASLPDPVRSTGSSPIHPANPGIFAAASTVASPPPTCRSGPAASDRRKRTDAARLQFVYEVDDRVPVAPQVHDVGQVGDHRRHARFRQRPAEIAMPDTRRVKPCAMMATPADTPSPGR